MDPAAHRDPGSKDIPCAQLPRPPEKAPAEDDTDGAVMDMNVGGAADHEIICAQEGHAMEAIGQDTLPRPPEALTEAEAKTWAAFQALLPEGHEYDFGPEGFAGLMKDIHAICER